MTEKESLLVLNQEIKSDLSFCRDCAVSQGATGWVKDFDRLLDKNEILNNKLKRQFSSCSKLSIPKKIAELINTGDTEYIRWSFADDFIPDNYLDLDDEWEAHNKREAEIVRRKALVSAYLAGKALGVELVEVSDE